MTNTEIQQAAEALFHASKAVTARAPLAEDYPTISLEEGYQIQFAGRALRKKFGAQQVGWKMGLTSAAKRKQMGLEQAIFGYILEETEVSENLSLSGLIHPKIEMEIAFRLKSPLAGKISIDEAFQAIESCYLALEVIDSRYRGFKYFSLPDVVADNCSSGRFVLGAPWKVESIAALEKIPMRLENKGEIVAEALSSEISGHPLQSLCELSAMVGHYGERLNAGEIVLAGSAAPALELKPGDVYSLTAAVYPRAFCRVR